jgi:hypothetical protein
MTRGPSLITTMLLTAAIIINGSRAVDAQEQTPNPRMLLNLDLFAAHSGGNRAVNNPAGPATATDDSMLQQLQTLRAMGYLSPDGPLPASANLDDAGSPTTNPIQANPRAPQ